MIAIELSMNKVDQFMQTAQYGSNTTRFVWKQVHFRTVTLFISFKRTLFKTIIIVYN